MTLDEAKEALNKAQTQYNQAAATQDQLRTVIPYLQGVVQALEDPEKIQIINGDDSPPAE